MLVIVNRINNKPQKRWPFKIKKYIEENYNITTYCGELLSRDKRLFVGKRILDSNRQDTGMVEQLTDYLNPSNTLIHYRNTGIANLRKLQEEIDEEIKIINSIESINTTSIKHITQFEAIESGISTPDTYPQIVSKKTLLPFDYFYEIKKLVTKAFEERKWNSCILKPCRTSLAKRQNFGKFTYRFHKDSYKNQLEDINLDVPYYFVQEEVIFNRLMRFIIIGGKILEEAVTYDFPRGNDWKCSVCMNPQILHEKNPTSESLEFINQLTSKVSKTNEIGLSYIDIFDTDSGYIFNEANLSCNLTYHETLTKYPIVNTIGDYLVSQHTEYLQG